MEKNRTSVPEIFWFESCFEPLKQFAFRETTCILQAEMITAKEVHNIYPIDSEIDRMYAQ